MRTIQTPPEEMLPLINEYLIYDSDAGAFFWKKITTNRVRIGSKAGRKFKNGYYYIGLLGRRYLVHRLVWLIENDRWPTENIDHINGDRTDNRSENLRECNQHQNGCNRGAQRNNTSGFKGVTYDKERGRWVAQTQFRGVGLFLGRFDTPEEAHERYRTSTSYLHGEFARPI